MQFPVQQYSDFQSASHSVLEFLHERIGFGLWMVTRTESEEWIVLHARDDGYGVVPGDVFNWMDSFCSRMINGLGPRVAPRSNAVPAYAAAPINQQVSISAYIGVPIYRPDGSFFGTLCAVDPNPQPDEIADELPLIELLASLLATILASELTAEVIARQAERASQDAMTDSLTGVYNRRGWVQLLEAEEARCHRYGHPATVFSIDVDGLKIVNDQYGHARGDELLVSVANALKQATRESDVIARIGGDEFAILAVECDPGSGRATLNRIRESLESESVSVSIGVANRSPNKTLARALVEADRLMYLEKRQRHASRQSRPPTDGNDKPAGIGG